MRLLLSGPKSRKPVAYLLPERFEIETTVWRRKAIEPLERPGEQRDCARAIAAAEMMESCTDLNERLKEALLRLGQGQPDTLPVLVGLEELPGAIAVEALGKGACSPVKEVFHASDSKAADGKHQRPVSRSLIAIYDCASAGDPAAGRVGACCISASNLLPTSAAACASTR